MRERKRGASSETPRGRRGEREREERKRFYRRKKRKRRSTTLLRGGQEMYNSLKERERESDATAKGKGRGRWEERKKGSRKEVRGQFAVSRKGGRDGEP